MKLCKGAPYHAFYDRSECSAKNQIYPLLGEKAAGNITAADIKNQLNYWMNKGYAYTTVKKPMWC